MSQDWTEKYRPRTLSDVIGNPKAVEDLRSWAQSWDKGIPKFRAVVLIGSPGIGKTTAAEALANDMGWGLLEMNASDQRTEVDIRNVAIRGAMTNTFTDSGDFLTTKQGDRKLIILDEADNLSGSADRRGINAITELIKTAKQPVILIVNDFYGLSKKSSAVKTNTIQITFKKPASTSIIKMLKKICVSEGISVTDEALRHIAENANGDMRAAVRDLESMAIGKDNLSLSDTEDVSGRNVRKSMYDLMQIIFRKSDAMGARNMVRDVDEDPGTVLLWLDENMPYEYPDKGDLVRGYEKLSRADIFLGRVSRRQYFGLWSYANDTMTAGVCVARHTDRGGREWFKFPGYLSKMSRSKSVRATKSSICQKLADALHTSTKRVAMDVMPSLKLMLENDKELRLSMIKDVGLDAEELAFLMNRKIDSKEIKEAVEIAEGKPEEVIPEPEVKEEPKAKPQPKQQRSLFDF